MAIHTRTGITPSASAVCTLTGSNPSTAGIQTYTSANTCTLASGTTYFVVLKAATSGAGNSYAVRHTANDAEALQPAANGWSIGNASFGGTTSNNTTTWTADAGSKALVMHIAAAARSPHVTNLGTTTTTGSAVSTTTSQSVAVTTGANSGGYTLTSVEIPLKQTTAGGVTVALHADASGDPAASAVANAAFTGTAPTGTSSFTDTTFTCAGTGCDLAGGTGGTKYHIVVTASSGAYEWRNSSSTPTETTVPTGSGWDIGDSHSKNGVEAGPPRRTTTSCARTSRSRPRST